MLRIRLAGRVPPDDTGGNLATAGARGAASATPWPSQVLPKAGIGVAVAWRRADVVRRPPGIPPTAARHSDAWPSCSPSEASPAIDPGKATYTGAELGRPVSALAMHNTVVGRARPRHAERATSLENERDARFLVARIGARFDFAGGSRRLPPRGICGGPHGPGAGGWSSNDPEEPATTRKLVLFTPLASDPAWHGRDPPTERGFGSRLRRPQRMFSSYEDSRSRSGRRSTALERAATLVARHEGTGTLS